MLQGEETRILLELHQTRRGKVWTASLLQEGRRLKIPKERTRTNLDLDVDPPLFCMS